MDRNEVHSLLKEFAENIGAIEEEDYILSQKVMGMGKSIELKDKAIRKFLKEMKDDYSLEMYEQLISEINGA
tara:strand:- start:3741 stop:3956 length:216 start_codon:yes stop_codon:yes gene_type:complete